MSIKSYYFLLFGALVALSSCKPNRDIIYFKNMEAADLNVEMPINNILIPTIQPDDLLSITVNSLSVESNMLFNQGVLGTLGSNVAEGQKNVTIQGYLVDREGNINFPVMGLIHLGGLTKDAAQDTIQNRLNRNYIKDCTVNIRFLNFEITLIGEVKRASTISVLTETINILEALSLAGDINPLGRKDNVLIIREKDGIRKFIRIDLNDKNLVNSPNYYLQQNDVVYVEADKAKAAQASFQRANLQYLLGITLSAITIVTLVVAVNR